MAQARKKTRKPAVKKPELKAVANTPEQEGVVSAEAKALLREVDETLHYEKMQGLWQQWRVPLIGGILAVFALVIGQGLYAEYRAQQQEARALAFWEATRLTNDAEKFAALKSIVEEENGSFSLLAALTLAGLQMDGGDAQAAQASYDAAIAQSGAPLFEELAEVYKAQAALVGGDVEQAVELFTPLAQEGRIFRATALDGLAQAAEARGELATAFEHYEQIMAMEYKPQDLSSRVQARLNELRVKMNEGAAAVVQ